MKGIRRATGGAGILAGVSFALALIQAAFGEVATGRVFHIDPLRGSMENDGSVDRPWRTLEEVLGAGLVETRRTASYPWQEGVGLVVRNPGAPVKAGDTLRLHGGHHGEIDLIGGYNELPVTVEAAEGESPTLGKVRLAAASGWILRGLVISPEEAPSYSAGQIVRIESHSWHGPAHDITVEGCLISSVRDSSEWTLDDWNTKSASGISVGGDRCVIRGNHLLNVNFGISVGADDCLVEHNTVENFSGDGLRGLGDNGVFQYNTVMNCYDVNGNHDDGFQSWSTGEGGVGTGVVRGIVLRGNVFINYSDENQPFRGTLQGIGCFDGFFEDWVVENNVIIVDHWHGLSLYGARNCRVVNNTVIDINGSSPGPPWIRVAAHKNGSPSTGCLVRNNLSTAYTIGSDPSMLADHNVTVTDPAAHFADPAGHDLRLKAGSTAIDAGTSDGAPEEDLQGVPRPQGAAVDAGALEREADTDNDLLPDWWELRHFKSLDAPKGGASEDFDGDGAGNLDESTSGSDPTDPNSVFRVRHFAKNGGVVWLEWPSARGTLYEIERATDAAGPFEPLEAGIPATAPENRRRLTAGPGRAFFRIRAKP